jgi:hypothetical protein
VATNDPTGQGEQRYEVHRYADDKLAIYDREGAFDVAHVARASQARALVDGLNDGALLVDEQGLIVEAADAEAGAR